MEVEYFFDLLLAELESNPNLRTYYKFLNSKSSLGFRKSYFCQRLQYVADHVQNPSSAIWDCGCGFGTTAIFLALNGFKVYGTTIEFYFKEIPKRLEYWSRYGDISLFSVSYENLFDQTPFPLQDIVIVQDTLHHLEPLDTALKIISQKLSTNGKIIVIEENGNNIIQQFKLFLKRGNKKVIEIYDPKLDKRILLGNENIRNLKQWQQELIKHNLNIDENSVQYIRFYPPFCFNKKNAAKIYLKEQTLSQKSPFLKEYFFFGVNFTVTKQ